MTVVTLDTTQVGCKAVSLPEFAFTIRSLVAFHSFAPKSICIVQRGIPMRLLSRKCLLAVAGIGCAGASTMAVASPVTYTGFAVTDVRLGDHHYHQAQVFLRFVGDTTDVHPLPPNAPVAGAMISKGSASLEIVKGGQRVKARFMPDQLVVSVDHTNGGVGFGAMFGGTFAPAYPLAFDGANVFGFDELPEPDLVTPGSWADHAWSCIGFPVSSGNGGTGKCADPASHPLKTDRGDFFIYQPYLGWLQNGLMTDDYAGSLNTGIFSVVPGPP